MLDATKTQLIELSGRPLKIGQVAAIADNRCRVELDDDPALLARMRAATDLVSRAVDEHWSVYGVTTGFGGMANVPVPRDLAAASQNNLLSFLATSAGESISQRHVRAAMALRANVLLQGKSGVRLEIIQRLVHFLQSDATPIVRELGSIGASGDLIPLSTIARAITGQTRRVDVQLGDQVVDGLTAIAELDLEPLILLPKEGLAIVNGTSFSSAIAANCVFETRSLMAFALGAQAMMLQALEVQESSFEAFVHRHKPHPGQVWTARIMQRLLAEGRAHNNGQPADVQDRYSLRCFPQYFGPLIEGISRVSRVVEVEMNSVSDNPLVDVEGDRFCQSGNFLGQYVGIAMDDLRRYVGLMAKHLDVQIATLVAPEFNKGLPPSLWGNDQIPYNMGLKGLQITGNSIAPMLTYYGNPVVEHFPTHAEQFNQNVNGLSWTAANLAWKSVELFQSYMAVSLIFGVQALDLRAKASLGHYDGRALLGTMASELYSTVCGAMQHEPGGGKPFVYDDADLWLEEKLELLQQGISDGSMTAAVAPILESFDEHEF